MLRDSGMQKKNLKFSLTAWPFIFSEVRKNLCCRNHTFPMYASLAIVELEELFKALERESGALSQREKKKLIFQSKPGLQG